MSRPVRVLHVIDTLGGGGSERWLWEIVRLADVDTAHRVVTAFSDPGTYAYGPRLRARDVYRQPPASRALVRLDRALHGPRPLGRGVVRRLVGMCWVALSVLAASLELIRAVRAFRPTAIHAHGFIGYVLALVAGRLTRTPLVHTVPCLVAQMVEANASWLPGLYRRTHPAVEHFFTNMPDEQRALGIPDRKLFLIPGAVDLDAVREVDRERQRHRANVRSMLGIPEAAFVCISVGRLHPTKGHAHAIAAIAALAADVRLIVLGAGPSEADLRAQAERLQVTDRVSFAGYREDILEHYVAADVFLRVMTLEGDNMSSLLAMAMGLPIIAFDTQAESDLIPTVGHGVLVPVGDDAALASAVRRLREDEAARTALGARGVEFARRELDVRRTVSAYHVFYREGRARMS
jgi:glycosyltransferase involved in cell wall biosynthesis